MRSRTKQDGLVAMVVDDDVVSNIRLAHLTQFHDINVIFVESTGQAVDYFHQGLDPDMLLLPWDEQHKESTTSLIQSLKLKGFRTPVVLLTKYSKDSEEYILCHEKGFEIGAVAVIDKPYCQYRINKQLKAVSKIAHSKAKVMATYKPITRPLSQLLDRFA